MLIFFENRLNAQLLLFTCIKLSSRCGTPGPGPAILDLQKIVNNWDQFTDSFVDFKCCSNFKYDLHHHRVCVCGEKSLSYTNQ